MTYIEGLHRSMNFSKKKQRTPQAIREAKNRYEVMTQEREENIYGDVIKLGIDNPYKID